MRAADSDIDSPGVGFEPVGGQSADSVDDKKRIGCADNRAQSLNIVQCGGRRLAEGRVDRLDLGVGFERLGNRLGRDGIVLHEGARVTRVEKTGGGVVAYFGDNGGETRVQGSHLLVAAGRRPSVDGLDLGLAGIEHSPGGIRVDARLRTTNKKVFAIGDVTGGYQFTHVAAYHAGIVLRNALFRLPAKVDESAIPWVTYTQPELAQVGLTEDQARARGGAVRVLRWPFAENDRAQAERRPEGMVKVVTGRAGRILGAGIVGAGAGELIQTWVLAIGRKMKIGAMAGMIAPYPTLGEASKRAAGSYFAESLFSGRTKAIVRFLGLFG